MKKSLEKTTILIVNKNQQGIKPIQISSKLLANWRKYVGALVLLFLTMISGLAYLTREVRKQDEMQRALTRQLTSMHILMEDVDTLSLRQKFDIIDKELSTINKYLKVRGLKPVFKEAMGGEIENDILSTIELSSFYGNYLKKISSTLAFIPLGLPFTGRITSAFGHRENPFSGYGIEMHKGLDIKGPYGAPVKSIAKGKVIFSGGKGGYGNCIILEHGNGYQTLYGHLSKILAQKGQAVEIGQQIGSIGSTGRSTGPHLHYEVHYNGKNINPQSFLTLE